MTKARLAIEAGVSMGWERWVGERGVILGIERFGASAPFEDIYREFGLTIGNIVERSLQLVR
jgi:transketolase